MTSQQSGLKKILRDQIARARLMLIAAREEDISDVAGALEEVQRVDRTIARYEIVSLFKQLEEIGLGKFRAGRRGKESRMVWNRPLRLYLDEIEPVKERSATLETLQDNCQNIASVERPGDTAQKIRHTYWLRTDCAIHLELPANFTDKEAARFAEFVRTLPIE